MHSDPGSRAGSAGSRGIVVFGEALVDVFPDAEVVGGAPFNVARNLALLGAPATMVTRIGDDAAGARIAAEFAALGMDTRGLQRDPTRPTGTVAVELHDGGHRFRIARDVAWDALDAEATLRCVRAVRPRLACFGTLAQRDPVSRAAIRAGLAATDATRVLDLNLRDGDDERARSGESLGLADVVKVNDDELARLLEWFGNRGDAALPVDDPRHAAAVRGLMLRHRLRRLVVTRGADGWACFDPSFPSVLTGSAPAVDVVDTVGAGDAFTAVLLLGIADGWPLPATLERAAAHAAAVCGVRGAVARDAPYAASHRDAWGDRPTA